VIPRQSHSPSPPAPTSPGASHRPSDRSAAPSGPAVRLITVSAAYGAGGSVVAPALADRFGLPFLQRVTTSEGRVAAPGPCDEQLSEEEVKATPVHRLLAHLTQAMPAGPTQSPPSTHHQDEHLRARGEAGIHRLLAERRVFQGAAIEGISEEQARERLCAADKARTAYVRRLYRTDPADPSLYHLVIDSTAMPLDTVIELIVPAARAHEASVPERSEAH
jgi:Cytidylate kinase-like family